ncbi:MULTISPECIES: MaoC family dehydratase N-terminal domain-containing protein [unclassified Crossiella]|uniref:MaoC family dehydratase N-terminal domain-containing protein n=1 Tax=unclassified Crossiella TaxID=2620835 RepID=UPI002000031B|nr:MULTISPECIES: MaoC family dehydratase N-terminal domain-containing protein [unclassified Crossiella]MCK2243744.1 MaoC family dehydratase N-terminal domain-containing protein [Crossiella sp. S99.2]MCK2257603.1 MaoC family dehydratase N-terminal domain-containing protein [Crossiella sp. S99.1]
MPIDPDKAKAWAFPPITTTVERGRLRLFAQAIGENDPIYSAVDSARRAGYPDLPIPPTFLFSLELETPEPLRYLSELGVDLRQVLHGEQSFTYHAVACAGDTLTLRPRIVDVYSKKGGALQFLIKQTDITRDGDLLAEASTVIIVRDPEARP